MGRARLRLTVLLLAALACGRNPVLGEWEIDRESTDRGVLLAVEAMELSALSLRGGAIVAAGTEIPVEWVVEEPLVRAVRADGRGEHAIELLPDGRIRVELPTGIAAEYRKRGA